MAIGFLLHKGQLNLAKAEVDVVAASAGFIVSDFYVIDLDYSEKLNFLAFTKAIYELELKNKKMVRKRLVVDLNKLNKFQKRRAHLLPAGHPAMTHPRLARAMINLSGAEKEVLDPFCGGSGILIEAGFCGLHMVGFDIDNIMLKRANKNLTYFKFRNFDLKKQDATTFSGRFEAVVTDLPYGKNTKVNDDLESLYLAFLKNVKRNRISKLVVGFPDFVNCSGIVRKAGFKIKKEFDYYLHKNLSKKILVLT